MGSTSWAGLYECLRELRLRIAHRNRMAAGWCNNKVLQEISRRRPSTRESLGRVPGIKPRHMRFAEPIVTAITEYCSLHTLPTDIVPQRRNRNVEKENATRQRTRATVGSFDGVDRGLFHVLMNLREDLCRGYRARSRIFVNFAIRDMARRRPSTREGFLKVYGVGEKKCEQYGELFLAEIKQYCKKHSLEMDVECQFEDNPPQTE
jgi:superfamily II DNA helicase RecQ